MAALMSILTIAVPALAATNLSDYPTFLLATNKALEAYVVVGSAALTSDVVGAIDLATTLAQAAAVPVSVPGTSADISGLVRDGISIGLTSTSKLSTAAGSLTAFPTTNLTSLHYSGLKQSAVVWTGDGASYDYREQVDVVGGSTPVYVRHDLNTDKLNGTVKLVVGSGSIKYQYVFNKEFNFTVKDATKGTIAAPQYTYPLKIQLLGKDFTLVGVGATSIKMLSGATGTATATRSVDYGNYKFYAIVGSTNAMQIDVKDVNDNFVETLLFTGLSSGTVSTKSTTMTTPIIDVSITAFGTLTDGTVIGADLVIGPSGTTTKEYDSTADVESTGVASDAFPGAPRWGISYLPNGAGDDRKIPAGSIIQVAYKPSDTEYVKAGEKISLPNNYGDLKFVGWDTNNFATITIKPYGSVSAYTITNKTTLALSEAYGFEISSDVPGSIGSTSGNYFDKAYILFGKATSANNYPVAVGFYDKVSGKILVSDSAPGVADTGEYKAQVNASSAAFTYNFTLSYGGIGETSFRISTSFTTSAAAAVTVDRITVGTAGSETIVTGFRQKATPTWSTTSAPQFQLGATSGSKDDYEVNVTTEGTSENCAGKTQEVVDDSGILVQSTSDSTSNNALVSKIPSKALAVKVYFGKESGTTTTGSTYNQIVPITTAVAKLDSEITTTEKAKNLVLVGGPCVNTLVANLATAGKFDYTCANWPGSNFAIIKVVDDGFTTGKVALVVAGTRAADTRLGTSVLQLYNQPAVSGKLVGTTVTVTGTTVATATITAA